MVKTFRLNRIKTGLLAFVFVFASIVLPFGAVQNVSAATLTWTGDGDGSSFSDGNNWNTASAPVDGDVLNFSYVGLGSYVQLTNDIVDLSVAGITVSGTPTTYSGYTITGSNDLTLTGNISNTATYSGSEQAFNINTDVILGADVTVTGLVSFTGETNKVNVQNNTLTLTSAAFACKQLSGLIGTGSVSIGGVATALSLRSANAGFSGNVNISSGSIILSDTAALGSGSLTVSGAGSASLYAASNSTWTNAFTLGGSGAIGAQHFSSDGCSGASPTGTYTATLTGNVTLTSDFKYNGSDNMIINGTYADNGFDFTVSDGALGTITTPNGEAVAPVIETDLDDNEPSTHVSVVNKETATLNGTRGNVFVNTGGTLKGTGTATLLSNSGTVNPGNSPGTLTVLETYSGGGTLQIEVLNADSYDQLRVGEDYVGAGSAVTLDTGAILEVILYEGWSIEEGDQFTIIDNRSETPVSGIFSWLTEGIGIEEELAEGAQFERGGITFTISYEGGDGNDVVLTALNTGSDPNAPDTGIAQFVTQNPLLIILIGVSAAASLVVIRRLSPHYNA